MPFVTDPTFTYDSEEIKFYANQIISTLPDSSFKLKKVSDYGPTMYLIINREALDVIYNNKKVIMAMTRLSNR